MPEDLLDKSEFYKILALRFAKFHGLKSRICSGTEQLHENKGRSLLCGRMQRL